MENTTRESRAESAIGTNKDCRFSRILINVVAICSSKSNRIARLIWKTTIAKENITYNKELSPSLSLSLFLSLSLSLFLSRVYDSFEFPRTEFSRILPEFSQSKRNYRMQDAIVSYRPEIPFPSCTFQRPEINSRDHRERLTTPRINRFEYFHQSG